MATMDEHAALAESQDPRATERRRRRAETAHEYLNQVPNVETRPPRRDYSVDRDRDLMTQSEREEWDARVDTIVAELESAPRERPADMLDPYRLGKAPIGEGVARYSEKLRESLGLADGSEPRVTEVVPTPSSLPSGHSTTTKAPAGR